MRGTPYLIAIHAITLICLTNVFVCNYLQLIDCNDRRRELNASFTRAGDTGYWRTCLPNATSVGGSKALRLTAIALRTKCEFDVCCIADYGVPRVRRLLLSKGPDMNIGDFGARRHGQGVDNTCSHVFHLQQQTGGIRFFFVGVNGFLHRRCRASGID